MRHQPRLIIHTDGKFLAILISGLLQIRVLPWIFRGLVSLRTQNCIYLFATLLGVVGGS